MASNIITCPYCNKQFDLSDAYFHSIRDKILKDEGEKIAQQVKEKYILEIKDREEQIMEKDNELKTARENELELRKQQRKLNQEKENLELEIERKLATSFR